MRDGRRDRLWIGKACGRVFRTLVVLKRVSDEKVLRALETQADAGFARP